ncbi:hypothetical protein CCY01nite_02770 [Chitinophaga cymbidii]|uniref:DUF5017 domain-containing protein n=2 Tax=Chitinophaga cymbidii TaxID=1096750 RepID=A0A512RE87_9BACT|nr:hypothetical protein CCY01nite_02770 [Chitinophaga cymbidii]
MAFITACSTKDVPEPEFAVTPRSENYALGDSSFFYFTGNPYYITFYSGEQGAEYRYRNRITAAGTPQLEFTSYRQGGNQDNSLQLMISTDFPGIYDSASVYSENTHWTDITDRATLSTGSNNTKSGVVDLSDFLNDGKPVYIAYKYTGQNTNVAQRTWTIPLFTVTNVLEEDDRKMPVAASVADAAWAVVKIKNANVQWKISATNLKVTGGAAGSEEAESWVITKALVLNKATPDKGKPIKNMAANALASHYYIYANPGTYTATFEVSNTTVYESKTSVKEVPVTITP